MKYSLRPIFSVFVAVTMLPFSTFAAASESPYKNIEEIYARSHTIGELLENFKDKIPTADYNYIRQLLKDSGDLKLPQLKISGEQMMMSGDGLTVSLKSVPGKPLQFTLNNHLLDFGKVTDPAARFKMCEAAMPKSSDRGALWNYLLPDAHAGIWDKLAYGAIILVGYIFSIILGNDNQCKEIGLALDSCRKKKRKIEIYYRKMENAFAQAQKDSKTVEKGKAAKKKSKKGDDEDDPDEDLKNYTAFKIKMKKEGICPLESTNADLDDETADMFSEVSRTLQVTQSWLARCSKDHQERVEKCIFEVSEHAKKLCFHLSINALAVINNESTRTEVAIPIDPMGTGNPANK